MTFPKVDAAQWRAQVDKDLAGAPTATGKATPVATAVATPVATPIATFEKALVHVGAEGLPVQPLYTEALPEASPPGVAPFVRGSQAAPAPFRVCMRHDVSDAAALKDDLDGGADALWLGPDVDVKAALATIHLGRVALVLDGTKDAHAAWQAIAEAATARGLGLDKLQLALGLDPLGAISRGRAGNLSAALDTLMTLARALAERCPTAQAGLVSTLAIHDAGGDATDELAWALASGVVYLRALGDGGLDLRAAARQLALQVSVGRDTFAELCKLRALRLVWHKLLAAAGVGDVAPPRLHAVASTRTATARDPWVNFLRVTTQLFAGVLGGADWVTPLPFDAAIDSSSEPSALARRVARNTGLVLREESALGRVLDPAGGSYYLEALTDALAREGWRRFQAIEAEGGLVRSLTEGKLQARVAAGWHKWSDGLAKRKDAITGVSVFANLDEKRPASAPAATKTEAGAASAPAATKTEAGAASAPAATKTEAGAASAPAATKIEAHAPRAQVGAPWAPLPRHRDAEAYERLRDRADGLGQRLPAVGLVTLGPPAEYRPRLGFASAFFGGGGLRAKELRADESLPAIVCLCGSDERYVADAADAARRAKAAGAQRVLLAGRPGALEATLREAGVDGFIFVGCDVVKTLSELLGVNG